MVGGYVGVPYVSDPYELARIVYAMPWSRIGKLRNINSSQYNKLHKR